MSSAKAGQDEPQMGDLPRNKKEVAQRVVAWVKLGMDNSNDGPATFAPHFSDENAVDEWKHAWGDFSEKHLGRHPEDPKQNPWPNEYENVFRIAVLHGLFAAQLASERGHATLVDKQDFVDAGKLAAQYCVVQAKSFKWSGCWCNDC